MLPNVVMTSTGFLKEIPNIRSFSPNLGKLHSIFIMNAHDDDDDDDINVNVT